MVVQLPNNFPKQSHVHTINSKGGKNTPVLLYHTYVNSLELLETSVLQLMYCRQQSCRVLVRFCGDRSGELFCHALVCHYCDTQWLLTEDGVALCANVIINISRPTKKPSRKQSYSKRENFDL